MKLHQPHQFEATPQGADGDREIEGYVSRLEGRLALVQIAEGSDLRRQDRAAPSHRDKGVGQGPCAPPSGGEDNGLGQGVRP